MQPFRPPLNIITTGREFCQLLLPASDTVRGPISTLRRGSCLRLRGDYRGVPLASLYPLNEVRRGQGGGEALFRVQIACVLAREVPTVDGRSHRYEG